LNTQSNPEATNPAVPNATQLADARRKQWHQQDEALLTMENLRSWINATGLVLFVPRPQIVAPAPSLVEAVLGAPTATPTIEQTAQARSLLARLVGEGLAVPLNLLGAGAGTIHAGAPGDTPDFVASTAVFSYVFTLRGDKAWKQPPATSGAFKVSPLALATHEALSRRGPLSAYDLSTEVGKEVTEAAVLRALAELWTHLRVLPLPQPNGAASLWELTSARYTKQIKAGANAGLPSALSALISLYLGQAVVASEDEIESFLSPLAARSRIRDVVHALLSARQLETVAVEGRTMLYVAGSLPAFLAPEGVTPEGLTQAAAVIEPIAVEAGAVGEEAPRITKYVPRPRKIGTGYLGKAKPSQFGAKPFGERQFSAAKPGPIERGKRPGFSAKPGFGAKPGFKSGFKAGSDGGFKGGSGGGFKARRSGEFKPGSKARAGTAPVPDRERRPFSKPAASRSDKTAGFKKTDSFDKPWEEEKARVTKPRGESRSSEARPPRKTFSKPGTFGRKREGPASRPTNRGDARTPRKDFAPRKFTGKPSSKQGGFAGKKLFGKSLDKPAGFAGKKPFAKSSDKPGAHFAGKPAGTFTKFAGKRKPFGKRPPARKYKPREDGAA
jgi:hypothetical protein